MLAIKIIKNKINASIYCENMPVSIDEIIFLIEERNIQTIYFETHENERMLMSGYLTNMNPRMVRKKLQNASKAQI